MPLRRIYIKPFNDDGSYQSDYIDVTKYLQKIGTIETDVDSLDYQLGIFRNSGFDATFSNRDGKFADASEYESFFKFKRTDTQVRVTWAIWNEEPRAGWVSVPFQIGEEVEVFEGLLVDEATRENAKNEDVAFKILGFESIFSRVEVPFSDIANGDTIGEIIYACLNQPGITDLITVDIGNVALDQDIVVDDVSNLENKTVKEALNALLGPGNSVLYIRNRIVYVTSREESPTLMATFYGQASIDGVENIIDVKDLSGGLNKTFNYVTWSDTAEVQSDASSIDRNGIRKIEVSFDGITDATRQNTILSAILSEFKDPKKEFEFTVPMTYENLALQVLDKVSVDYPTVFVPARGRDLPICGQAICGEAVLPKGLWSLTIGTDEFFKITRKKVDVTKHEISFKLRGV